MVSLSRHHVSKRQHETVMLSRITKLLRRQYYDPQVFYTFLPHGKVAFGINNVALLVSATAKLTPCHYIVSSVLPQPKLTCITLYDKGTELRYDNLTVPFGYRTICRTVNKTPDGGQVVKAPENTSLFGLVVVHNCTCCMNIIVMSYGW